MVGETESVSGSGSGSDRSDRGGRRGPWTAAGVIGLALLAGLGYALGVPVLRNAIRPAGPSVPGLPGMSIAEEIRGHALEVFAVVWLFFLGASIGSFLNVVIYRVPRGMTLFGHSQCPRCGHAIRGRHNVPVLGWFLLNGRCYDCGQPIARRYPTVEAICGAMFVGLAFIELVSGGMNLPARPPSVFRGIAWIVLDPQGDLLAIYAYHCVLLSILFSWAWIAHDGGRVPAGYTLFAFALILAGPLAAPDAHPVPAWGSVPGASRGADLLNRTRSFGDGIVGGAVGYAVGFLVWRYAAGGRRDERRRDESASMGLIGAAFGWQATCSVALLAVPITALPCGARRLRAAPSTPASGFPVWLAALAHLVVWRASGSIPIWPSDGAPWFAFPIAVVAAAWGLGEIPRSEDAP